MKEGIPQHSEESENTLPRRKFNTAIHRVIDTGIDAPLTEEDFLGHFEKKLEYQKFDNAEIKKTPVQIEIIEDVCKKLLEFLKMYGLESRVDFSPDNVHIFDVERADMSEEEKEKLRKKFETTNGSWHTDRQGVSVPLNFVQQASNLKFAEVIAHEFIHGLSFQSVDATNDRKKNDKGYRFVKFNPRRIGVSFKVSSDDESTDTYFNEINEAITQELTLRFMRVHHKGIRHLEHDVTDLHTEMLRKKADLEREGRNNVTVVDEVTGEQVGSGDEIITRLNRSYPSERRNLEEGIKKLYEKSKGKFTSEEAVFRFLTEAYFSGRVLEFARLVKGLKDDNIPSFRELGRRTKKQK